MLIKKEYKFYAGHRNQDLIDKCYRPHGHHYLLSIFFEVIRNGSVTTLFSEFDDKIEPWIKENLDHRFFLDKNDTLAKTFDEHKKNYNEDLGACLLPFPSSVENVCFFIFFNIKENYKFNILYIELKETSSSTVIYSKDDYSADLLTLNGHNLILHHKI